MSWLIHLSPHIQVPVGAQHLPFSQVLAKDTVSHADQDALEYDSNIVLISLFHRERTTLETLAL